MPIFYSSGIEPAPGFAGVLPHLAPITLYQGWLMVGYATVYTMAPVFSLVLDWDVDKDMALLYLELYKNSTKVSETNVQPLRLARLELSGTSAFL